MKSSRPLSITLATVLAASGTLLIAGPASAATTIGDYTFYDATDFGQETTDYPAEDWFFGDASGVDGPSEFTRDGLGLNAPAQSGNVQILNQNIGTQPATVADFIDLVATLRVHANNSQYTIQIPVFGEPTAGPEFTTLRPSFQGNIDSGNAGDQLWVTSWAIPGYAAGATDTLENLVTALYANEAPELLAYGVWVAAAETTTIRAIEWGGEYSVFLPVPTRSISHTTISITDATSTGFTLTGTNWLPNGTAFVYIEDPDGNTIVSNDFPVDANGNVTVPIVLPSGSEVGTYSITFDDDGFYYGIDFMGDPFTTLEVTAALAATGADDSALALGVGGVLLLAGAGILLVSRTRIRQLA